MVRFSTEERLQAIMDEHEAMGAMVFNPHRYTLEEGGMKQTDATQLAFKRETDPQGLLNPGKMIAWEDPNFDYSAGKNFLFPGPRSAGARGAGLSAAPCGSWSSSPTRSRRASRRRCTIRSCARSRAAGTTSTIATSMPRSSIPS